MFRTASNNLPPANGHSRGFARFRNDHPVVTFKRNGSERSITLNPIATSAVGGMIALLVIGLLSASAYLFLRDDLVSATLARHARMQHAYEDRITALRSQVDLVTSRQMLDQQAVESRVAKLMARQDEIGARHRHVRKALARAGKVQTQNKTIPIEKTARGLRLGSLVGSSNPFNSVATNQSSKSVANAGPEFFDSLEATLEETERAQLAELKLLKKAADTKARKLASILTKQGMSLPANKALGGPLIELKGGNHFINTVNALDASLETLEKVRLLAKSLPHGSPAPGRQISSKYGNRKDPFTGRRAMHSGLDFRGKYGVPVVATASGTVSKAGRNGGYGNMIEIDHGGGITTRYAHLSKILVRKGQRIARGVRIGKIGSTGRSTGPHLHYEVRRNGQVLNPIHYVRLAKYMKPYL